MWTVNLRNYDFHKFSFIVSRRFTSRTFSNIILTSVSDMSTSRFMTKTNIAWRTLIFHKRSRSLPQLSPMVLKMFHISRATFYISYRREIEPFISLTPIMSSLHGCEFFFQCRFPHAYLPCPGIIHFLVTFLSGRLWIPFMVQLAFPVSTSYTRTVYPCSSLCLLMVLFTMSHQAKAPTC